MKKIFVLMVLCILSMNVSAQKIDSLQCNSVEARIDSLATQLSKLQKDYDYLYCNHQLTCLEHELEILLNDIQISSQHNIKESSWKNIPKEFLMTESAYL